MLVPALAQLLGDDVEDRLDLLQRSGLKEAQHLHFLRNQCSCHTYSRFPFSGPDRPDDVQRLIQRRRVISLPAPCRLSSTPPLLFFLPVCIDGAWGRTLTKRLMRTEHA